MRSILLVLAFSCFSFLAAGQTYNYVKGTLNLTIKGFNPCGSPTASDNGYIEITPNAGSGTVTLIFISGSSSGISDAGVVIPVGSTYTFTSSKDLPDDTYNIIIKDATNTINTFATPVTYPPIVLTDLAAVSLSQDIKTNNTVCTFPTTGQVQSSISGGSQALAGGGSYTYIWSSNNSFPGLPTTAAVTNGTTPLNLATILGVPGLPGGTYTLQVVDNYGVCGTTSRSFTITDPSPTTYNVTTASPLSICTGDNISISLNASDGASVTYEIRKNGAATGITFAGTGASPFVMTFPSTTFVDNDVIQVRATDGFCSPATMSGVVALTINPLPTAVVSGGGAVCSGNPLPNITFTFTGTAPYNFSYTDGTTPVSISNYGSNTYTINNAPVGTYSVTALSDANTCIGTSLGSPVSVIVNPLPTATISGGGPVCSGSPLPNVTFTFTGTAPFTFTYTDGTTPVTVTNHPSTTFTISNAPVGTYSVTALTDANTCSATSFGTPVSVIVNPLPTATVSGGGTICSGATLPNVTFTFTGTAPFTFTYTNGVTPVTVTNHPTTTFTLNNAPAGNYSVTALTDANSCAATSLGSPVAVVVNPLPTATVSGGGPVCTGSPLPNITFTFTGTAPFTFTYTDGTTPVTVTNHPTTTFTINNAPVGTYSVTALTDANCTGTSLGTPVSVIVNPLPTATVSGGGTVCSGATLPNVTFTFTGTAPFTFTYTDGTTPVTVTNHPTTTFTLNNAPAGNYSVTALTDANSCAATSLGTPVAVVVNPLPTATISGGGPVCSGSPLPNVTFTFTGTAPFTFTYTDGTTPVTITNHLTTTFTINNAPVGTYSVTALTDANCTGTSLGTPVAVIVNPLPTATVSGGGTVCSGATLPNVTFTFTGTAPFTFTYTNGVTPVTITNNPTTTFTLNNAPAGNYSVTALTDANSCAATSLGTPVAVVVNPLPTATVSGGGPVCTGSPLPNVTFTFTGTAPFTFTYTDGTTPVTITNHPTTTFTINNAPVGTYSVTALTDANCTGTSLGTPVAVIVNPLPTAAVSGGGTVCSGATLPNVTFTFTGTAPFTFTYTNGVTPVTITNNPTTTFTLNNAPAGNYSVTALTDANSCAATSLGTPVAVVVNPLPTATISGGGTVCSGATLPNVTFTFTGTAPFTFTYTDGTTPVTITNNPTTTFTINNAPAGNYSITALTDANCTGTSFGTPVAVVVSPLPTAAVSGGGTVCSGATLPNVTFTFTGTAPFTFTYTNGVTPVTITNNPTTTFTLNNAPAGNYSVTALTDANSCAATSLGTPVAVVVNPLPTATVSGGGPVCSGSTLPNVTFTFTGTAPFTFTYTDGTTPVTITNHPTTTFTINNAPVGTYSVTALTDANCTGTSFGTPVSVIVNPLPTAAVSGGGTVCSGATLPNVTFTFTGTAPFTFTYTDGTTPVTINNNPTTTFTLNNAPAGNYSVTALTDANCAATSLGTPVAVVVNPLPTATISGGGTVCSGGTLPNVTFTFTGTAPFTFTYTDGTTPVTITNHPTTTFTINNAPAGNYSISALTDVNCTATSFGTPVAVVVSPLPTATVNGGGTVCSGATLPNVTFTFTGTAPFTFTYTDGTTPVTITNNLTTTFTVNNAAAGNYSVTALTDANCAATSLGTPVAVVVNPLPTASVSGGGTVCSTDPLPNVVFTFTGTAPFTFTYTDGTTPVTITNNATTTFTLSNAPAGTYSVSALTDATSCNATSFGTSVAVIVNTAANAGADNTVAACTSSTAFDLYASLAAGPADAGGTWTDLDGSGVVITGNNANLSTITVAGAYRYQYTVTGTAPCANTSAIVTLNVTIGPDAGLDNAVTACNTNSAFDLFASLGGSPDVGGTWTDVDASGATITGNLIDLTTLSPGQFHFTYTVTGTAPCADATATVTINVINTTPDAGSDSSVPGCDSDTALNLFTSLGGTPDPGGVWTDLDASGAVITGNTVNLNGVAAGNYRYQYDLAVAGCGSASSVVTVTVVAGPNAGTDNSATACNSDNAFDLFASLGGSPANGGTWVDTDGSGAAITGNLADLTTVSGGATYHFTYTVSGSGPCPDASAVVALTVIKEADAGAANSVAACTTDAAFNLFSNLGGAPDAGGTWTDLDGSGAVITGNTADFTPIGVVAGTYRYQYTVTGTAPCANDQAIVTVTLNKAVSAGTNNTVAACSSEIAFDLFASLGGTPDAGGAWTDLSASGAVITGNTVDLTAVGTGAVQFQYLVAGAAPCVDATAIVTVNVTKGPNAGVDKSVTACNTNSAFDLFASLGGSPDVGGTWTDVDGSGATMTGNSIDLTTLSSSTFPAVYHFTYTVIGTAPCANATATITLNVINTTPDAGSDNSVSGCDSNTAFNLFASLGGTPDPGGIWTDMDASGAVITGDNVNLNGLAAASYRYQYNLAVVGCGNASSIVTVTVVPAANAGADTTGVACNSNNAFDLLASLGGSPTSGGSWTDVDGSGAVIAGNVADLTSVLTAGTYHFTYTVTGTSPCPNATATVTLTISKAPNSGTVASVSACTSDAAFNLFSSLGGTPDAGGTWTDLDGSNAVITGNTANFTGASVIAGTFRFQYTVTGTAPCVDAQTIVTVTLNKAPKAGTDKTVSACGSTSSFDLFASLGGTPDTGGTWTDLSSSGAVITGNNADFTLVATGTYQYQYKVTGTAPCVDATAIVTVNVTGAPTTANAGPDQVICGAAFTTLAANAPGAGETGTWTVTPSTGAVVTSGSPTSIFVGVAGTSYTLNWIITSGACTPSVDAVVINFAASPTSTSPVTVCVNTASPTLNATATGSTSIEWYIDAALTNLVFTGSNYTPASTELNMTTVASTTFYVIARYTCGASPATQVVVNVSNTGTCGGGGGTGTCATVVIDPVPTPANCALSTGSIMFNITPQVPAVNNTGVKIDITGPVNDTKFNAFNFTGLPAGKYDYTIEYGDPSCIKTGSVTIDKSGTVGTPVASSIVPPTCFGDSTGSAVIAITQPVDITGQALQWSLTPAVASSWKDFTAGGVIQGIPAGVSPSFNQTISVRKDAADLCYAGVTIVMPNGNPRIKSTYDITAATCNNNDGAITNIIGSGGAGGAYQFSLDGVTFQTTNSFTQLFGGYDTLRIKDNIGCIKDTVIHVTFPGEIDFVAVASSATCTNNGKSGEIDVTFASAGDYKVGISTDPLTEPTDYLDDPLNSTTFPPFTGLSRGTYYVWVKGSSTSACPSRQTVFVDGIFALSFTPVPICQDNLVSLRLENVTYDPSPSAGNISVIFDDFITGVNQITQPVINSTDILLDVNQSPWSNFFALKGKYRYHLEQFQTNFCLVESDTLTYEVFDQLQRPDTLTVKSFDDQQEGEIHLTNFAGGLPPYTIDISADRFTERVDEVQKNANLKYEMVYKNLYPDDYTIVLTDSLGCSVQFVATVHQDFSLFIPNIFTPNGDNDNPVFYIRNIPTNSKLVITNRWGKEVFSSNNYENNWSGEGVSDGIYYYYLKTPSETKSGWVEVLRGNKP